MFRSKKSAGTASFNIQLPVIPKLAPAVLKKAGFDLLQRVIDFHNKIFGLAGLQLPKDILKKVRSFTRVHGTTVADYSHIKETEGEVLKYYIALQKNELSKEEYENISRYLSAIRQSIHAAKSMYDIKHNLVAFHSSANNYLFQEYILLQQEWKEFEILCKRLLNEKNEDILRTELENSIKQAFRQFSESKIKIEKPLGNQEMDKVETSTLLNVYHEILSSKKALLRAIALLKLKIDVPEKPGEYFI
jgi:hypothetical protein